jgi:hypothetical protein
VRDFLDFGGDWSESSLRCADIGEGLMQPIKWRMRLVCCAF